MEISADFRLLGPLQVVVAGQRLQLPGQKVRCVLVALLLNANRTVATEQLTHAVWSAPPRASGSNLRTYTSRLRGALAAAGESESRLVTEPGGYRLRVEPGELDLASFDEYAAEGERAIARGDTDVALDRLRRALDLWRGRPLAGLSGGPQPDAEVSQLEERRLLITERWADAALTAGRHAEASIELTRIAHAYPFREQIWMRLMLALYRSGRQAAALTAYRDVYRLLDEELGVAPSTPLRRLHEQILTADPALDQAHVSGVTSAAMSEAPRSASRHDMTSSGESDHAESGPPPVSAHRQLPPDIADFTGREIELRELHQVLAAAGNAGNAGNAGSPGTALVVSAIEGMAGVGKTRLAVRLAHQLVRSGRHAGVQLYVDLRGHAPEPPADPAAVLASLLYLLGVPKTQIPEDLEGRAALYRDRLHDRHALVLLDNAADENQVRPLLPGGSTSLVLVTSRRVLALDGAHTVNLDVFTPPEAHALLVRIRGRGRVSADPVGARRIADLCGRLPIAVALAARRLRSRPAWAFGDLAARLERGGNRLGELAVGTRRVRAVFDLSYDALDPGAQRLFRLLGLHPGDDFTAESAAALAGVTPSAARHGLDHLVDEHLVIQVTAERHRLHDLLREYAAAQAAAHDDEDRTVAALVRVLSWYLYAADAAIRTLVPHRVELNLDERRRPPHLPTFGDYERAFRWLTAEDATLVAAVSTAAKLGISEQPDASPAGLGNPAVGGRVETDVVERTGDDGESDRGEVGAAAVEVGVVVTLSRGERSDDQPDDEHRPSGPHRYLR